MGSDLDLLQEDPEDQFEFSGLKITLGLSYQGLSSTPPLCTSSDGLPSCTFSILTSFKILPHVVKMKELSCFNSSPSSYRLSIHLLMENIFFKEQLAGERRRRRRRGVSEAVKRGNLQSGTNPSSFFCVRHAGTTHTAAAAPLKENPPLCRLARRKTRRSISEKFTDSADDREITHFHPTAEIDPEMFGRRLILCWDWIGHLIQH